MGYFNKPDGRLRPWPLLIVAVCGSTLTCSDPRTDTFPRLATLRLSQNIQHESCRVNPAPGDQVPWRCDASATPTRSSSSSHASPFRGQANLQRAHIRAVWELLESPSPDILAESLATLEYLQSRQETWQVANDKAVALAVRAATLGQSSDWIRAWEHTLEAQQLSPQSPTAVFNEALICSDLGLWQWADRAIQGLEELDPDSAWTTELVSRRNMWPSDHDSPSRGSEPTLDLSLAYAIESNLVLWAQHVETDPAGAAQALSAARNTAEQRARAGDTFLQDSLSAFHEGTGGTLGDPRLQDRLLEGLRSLGQVAKTQEFDRQRIAYQASGRAFAEAKSPLTEWTEIRLARLDFLQQEYERAIQRLGQLREVAPKDHLSIRGASWWIQGASLSVIARPFEALEAYQLAQQEYIEITNSPEELSVRSRIAELQDILGQEDAAWEQRLWVLSRTDRLQTHEAHFAINEASLGAKKLGMTRVARRLLETAVDYAFASRSPPHIVTALRYLADLAINEGDLVAAQGILAQAEGQLSLIEDVDQRNSVQVLVTELEGRIARSSAPQAAATLFNQALELASSQGAATTMVPLLIQRAEALQAAGDPLAARLDFRKAMRRIEDTWRRGPDFIGSTESEFSVEKLSGYLDESRPVFDHLIASLVDDDLGEEAFVVAETAKSLAWTTAFAKRHASEPRFEGDPIAAIARTMPAAASLVSYWVLENRLIIWYFSEGHLETHVSNVDRATLEERTMQLLAKLNRRVADMEVVEDLRWLRRVLVDPIQESLKTSSSLSFIPDGVLHSVPFAALRRDEMFLVESHPISISPCASLAFSKETSQGTPQPPLSPAVLTLSPSWDPRLFEGQSFPELAPLEGASNETRMIASLYRVAIQLEGRQATLSNLRAQIKSSQVLHLATHTLSTPTTSYLVLAADEESPRGLASSLDLTGLDLKNMRVVILSSCRSAGGHPSGSIGVSRLVSPFLNAGVPAVVASLWDVHDGTAPRLMTEFHRALVSGRSADEALQIAQVSSIRSPTASVHGIAAWASFQVVGNVQLDPERGSP